MDLSSLYDALVVPVSVAGSYDIPNGLWQSSYEKLDLSRKPKSTQENPGVLQENFLEKKHSKRPYPVPAVFISPKILNFYKMLEALTRDFLFFKDTSDERKKDPERKTQVRNRN